MNLLLPFVLMTVAYMVPHDVVKGQVVVQEVAIDSPAETAGIKAGDTILSVNGNPIESRGMLSREIQLNLGGLISLEVRHSDATTETVAISPRWKPPEGQGSIGVEYQPGDPVIVPESLPFWRAIPRGVTDCWETLILYKNGLIGMIIGSVPFVPAGPVGIVQVAGEVAQAGISPVLELTSVISIAIAITQLIPFPALDGGRLLFIFIEWIRRGKRVPPKVENFIHSIGFVVLLALMVLITYQDIARWITGGSLLP